MREGAKMRARGNKGTKTRARRHEDEGEGEAQRVVLLNAAKIPRGRGCEEARGHEGTNTRGQRVDYMRTVFEPEPMTSLALLADFAYAGADRTTDDDPGRFW